MSDKSSPPAAADAAWSPATQWLISTACGLLVANVYYAQPLIGLITAALGIAADRAGLLVTLPLAGYGLGLLLVVPLADLVENKRLVLTLVALEAVCMTALALVDQPWAYLAIAFGAGLSACAVQVLVPYVTFLAPEAQRGKAVGTAVSGVMLGIMLARPFASALTAASSWRAVFASSALFMLLLFVALRAALPARTPPPGLTYARMLASLGRIVASTPLLRRRGLYQACMFAAFSVFWTAVPLWLSGPQFGLSQRGIAWVALAGVAGAVAPPFAGRLADAGRTRLGTALAMALAALAFLGSLLIHGGDSLALGLLVTVAIVLDFAVSMNLVLSQRAIYALGAELRGRLNGLFMATFFVGGALGSAFGGWLYVHAGWNGVAALGVALPALGLLYFATERTTPTVTH